MTVWIEAGTVAVDDAGISDTPLMMVVEVVGVGVMVVVVVGTDI